MSSTYSVGKLVAALVSPSGIPYYGLFEQTYESNVFPQTPHWCAIHFGPVESCMMEIIKIAGVCEGGCLKEKGGDTTPSAYIKHWRAAMTNPVTLKTGVVRAEFGKGTYTLPEDDRQKVADILAQHGHEGIQGNEVIIDLSRQPEVLHALVEAGSLPWRFLSIGGINHEKADWAVYSPELTIGEAPDVVVFVTPGRHESNYWIVEGEQVKGTGWHYSTIQYLIDRFAIKAETSKPGSAESVIRAIRATVKAAVPMPMSQIVVIDGRKAEDSYHMGNFNRTREKLGIPPCLEIKTTLGEVLKADIELRYFADEMIDLEGLSKVVGSSGVQQDLLAA